MSNLVISVVAGSSLFVMLLFGIIGMLYRRAQLLESELIAQRQELDKLSKALPAVAKQSQGFQRKIQWLEQSFFDVRDQLDRHSLSGGNQAGYNQAVRLIGRGENLETLIDVCGLSRAEAELLVKMHKASNQSGLQPPAA